MTLITRAELLSFMRSHRHAVQSSTHARGAAQSAVVGIAVSNDFEIVFDTLESTRKAKNLRERPEIAFVIGGTQPSDVRTVQYEGVAGVPTGTVLARLTKLYLDTFPEGRERQSWKGLIYVRAAPTWIRYSDYGEDPPRIVELDRAALHALK